MNTRYLEEFLALSKELNWTSTAERLFTTRPTLVDHIRALEAELECKLVVSSKRGHPRLTPAGRRFTHTAQETIAQWESVRKEYRELADNLLIVRVASSNLPWLETILYKARRAVQERYPYKRIVIDPRPGANASIEALASGENDIVVAGYKDYLDDDDRPIPTGTCGFLLDVEEIKLLMTQENALFEKPLIKATDLDGATFVLPPDIYRSWSRDGMESHLAAHGANVTLRTLDFSGHTEYFTYEFGCMFGIVPATLVPRYGLDSREEFRIFNIENLPIRTRFYALVKQEFAATENGGLLFEEMRRIAGAHMGKDTQEIQG